MFESIKSFITSWNNQGVNLPMARDPLTGKGSISASLVILSSFFVILSLFTSKISSSGAFDFYLASATLYLGRKYQSKNGTSSDTKTT
jgi:hypothetical protein